jgi:hypothetical protein
MKQEIRTRNRDLPRGVFICVRPADSPLHRMGMTKRADHKEGSKTWRK